MGKGSRARPFEIDQDEFASAWERTFGKKDKETKSEEEKTNDNEKPEKDGFEKTK